MIYITAVHMEDGAGHEFIAEVKWTNPKSGETGQTSRQGMVTWIRDENGDARVRSTPFDVQVGVVEADPPYIRTYADGKWSNNLLALARY